MIATKKYLPLVFIPAVSIPLSIGLTHRHEATFFLGLSSSFWAGTAIGVTVVAGVAVIALLGRSVSGSGQS